MAEALPTYKGWTVDINLREFRKVDPSKPDIEFMPFDSEEGDEFLGEYTSTLDENKEKDRKMLEQISNAMHINY